MNGQDALAERLAGALRSRPDLLVLGEDVLDGGVFGLSRVAAADEDLRPRLCPTPLVPGTMAGHAAGLGLAGRSALIVAPSASAVLDGMADLLAAADPAAWAAMDAPAPFKLLVPVGPGLGTAEDADRPVEALLAAVPGLALLAAGRPETLLPAFDALLDAPGPTALLVPRRVLLAPQPGSVAALDPSGLDRLTEGRRGTIFAFADAVAPALEAGAGLDVTVAELWRLDPLPADAIGEAARTGHVVIAHPGPDSLVAHRIAAVCAGEAVWHLDGPVRIVGGARPPLGPAAEHLSVPDAEAIYAALVSAGAVPPQQEKDRP
ncbi:MAG: hypothetical protein D6705_12375 [Deltaproteobacteria bacterium]|nr:MAG: hypothetical protein D6705_12375 [Deltaproteobacteria bacterium]